MQAIILAAGMGKRLGELTKDNTKCMIKVHAVTLIERMLSQLVNLPINQIVIVIGYKGEKVKALIGKSYKSVPIVYIENNIYDKTNNIYSLFLAKDYLLSDTTLLLESDLILSDQILKKLIDHPYPNLAVVSKYQSWMDGTVVTLDDENNILNFISKKAFRFNECDTYYKTVNVYKFSKDFSAHKYVPFLEAYCKTLGNNEYYEQVLRVISLLDKPDLKALPLNDEKWYEIDDQQDLNNAEVLFSNEKDALPLYGHRYGGYWRFPHLIDFCYLVNPYFPSSKMKEEIKVNFDKLLSQYPSGMAVNAQLAARYMNIDSKQIVVGNGAAELIAAYLDKCILKTGIIEPTFEEYANRLSQEQIIIFTPENNNFSYTTNDIISYFENTQIEQLILINPDNPSGNFLDKNELFQLINWCKRKNIKLIIDESFSDFATVPAKECSLFEKKILQENPHLILIKSISKSYGVPGLRLGFMASGNVELIDTIKHRVSIWNINSFAEFYMQIFIKYQSDYDNACMHFINERDRFFKQLQKISFIRVIPSYANYFLCEVTDRFTARQLVSYLLYKYNLYLKDCSAKRGFNNQQYIRIAIRDKYDNDILLKALKSIQNENNRIL
ncbi:MAG: aminotransferase class I/II-fold pyridoxal phosphate-dependent enzyme [Bacteroidales bacterium]|nr:aminotransferase class I/II-fold pyridoxal phosphate-dependent enzyme [Bacteroidales bacterium]